MSRKIIYTRISSKYDDYSNWLENNPILLEGEFATAVDPNTKYGEPPKILVKVGDGKTAYKDLPFISSNSLDVPDWAKSNTKPVYTAEEIVGLDKYITGGGSTIPTPNPDGEDTNTQYDIIKVDDYTYQFVAKNIGDTEYTKISTIDIPKYPAVESGQIFTTQEGSGIILTDTGNNIIDVALDPLIMGNAGKELVTEKNSGVILTNLENNKVNIALDPSVIGGGSNAGKELVTEDDSGVILTELGNNKVNISLDTSVIGNSKEIIAAPDGGLVITQNLDDTLGISLNKNIVFLLNGGTSANI